jgi:hypothetical protein
MKWKCIPVGPSVEPLLAESLNNIFERTINGGDLTEAEAEHEKLLNKLGANTEADRECFDSLYNLIEVLIIDSYSSESGREELAESVARYIDASNAWISSQPGLEEFRTNKSLRSNPLNNSFYELYDAFAAHAEDIGANPQEPEVHFSMQTAKDFARFVIAIEEVSHRVSM